MTNVGCVFKKLRLAGDYSWLEQRNHNPRVGGSSPSSATISPNIINELQHLKNYFEAFVALHTSYTLFGWLPVTPDYIVIFISDNVTKWHHCPIIPHTYFFTRELFRIRLSGRETCALKKVLGMHHSAHPISVRATL